ncbi:MAG: phage holin family protein [Bacteroidales bacterium]|nr:phage holin family protein [Bacteroidales bacterium]
MHPIMRFLITVVSIIIIAAILPGIRIKGSAFLTATFVAIVIAILNVLVYPIMVLVTLPITILTMGLFLLVLNAVVIELASWMVPSFKVDSFGWAFVFSILLTIVTFVLRGLILTPHGHLWIK